MRACAFVLTAFAAFCAMNVVGAQDAPGSPKKASGSAPPAAPAQDFAREIPLYPGAAPGSEKWDWAEKMTRDKLGRPVVSDVVRPVLLHYPAEKSKAVGTAM